MYGSSGFLGGSSSRNAPLSWTSGAVNVNAGANLNQGVKIGKAKIDQYGNYIFNYTEIGGASIRSNALIANNGISIHHGNEVSYLNLDDLKNVNIMGLRGRSGTVTFSDGSSMTFEKGLLTAVKKGSS